MCFRPPSARLNKCYKCGKVNKPIDTVCVECGAKLEPGKEPCPQCETMMDPLAVCPNCGYVPEAECPKCRTLNLITSDQCAKCGFKAPKTAPPPGQAGGNLPPKAPPKVPPAPPKAPPKKPGE